MTHAAMLVDALRERGETVAFAESLTGGLLCATVVAVPGASDVVRGAIVAYAGDLKATLLGVDEQLLARDGTVAASTAQAMASGVAGRLGATYGLATTGVAGPDPSEGKAPGTVHVAVAGPGDLRHRELHLTGDRQSVRVGAVHAVLELLAEGL